MPRELTPINSSSDNNRPTPRSALISLLNHPMMNTDTNGDGDDHDHDRALDRAEDETEFNSPNPQPQPPLHTYSAVLTPSNLDACLALEHAIFPPAERCSREKLLYRLRACNELTLGLFTVLSEPPPSDKDIPTYPYARPIDPEHHPGQKQVLIGMIVATKTTALVVTDESMEMPDDAGTAGGDAAVVEVEQQGKEKKGHNSRGSTIAIHTIGILPSYQRQGLGRTLMRGYLQRMEQQEVGRRVALIAHGPLVEMYKAMGFTSKGESKVKFAGGGWEDLVNEFKKPEKPTYGRAGGF